MNNELPPYINHFHEETGTTFVFKRDDKNTRILHIENHTNVYDEAMGIDDAIDIFLNGTPQPKFVKWNKLISVTKLDDEIVWWYWINEPEKVVMIVSCFHKYKP